MIKASDLEGYVSPIDVTYQNALKSIQEKSDDAIHYAIEAELRVKVDREELLKALEYDRDQYRKGFAEGYYARDREIVRCGDCKYRSKLTSEDSYGVEIWVCNHDCGCAQCEDDDFCRYGER